jgi:signal transduction histidine kinase
MKQTSSIFFKLLMITLFAGVVVNVLVMSAFRLGVDGNEAVHALISKNALRYMTYIENEVRTSQDPKKARQISEEIGIDFRIERPNSFITSDPSLPNSTQLRSHSRHRLKLDAKFGRWNGRFFALREEGDLKILVFGPEQRVLIFNEEIIIGLLLLITAVLLGSFFMIRRLLKPIGSLVEGTSKVGGGEFDFRVPEGSKDELGHLGKEFNKMSKAIKSMFESKQQLLLDVSHEFRSPMTRMRVALEMMPKDKQTDRLRRDLSDLEKMTTSILEGARATQESDFHIQEVDLRDLVTTVLGEYEGHSDRISTSFGQIDLVKADPEKSATVIRNVLENALKYGSNSTKSIEVSVVGPMVRITNWGSDLPKEERDKIFEPFYRVDKSRTKETGGFGLGLNLCKRIMESQRGSIRLEEANPTCFVIEFSTT